MARSANNQKEAGKREARVAAAKRKTRNKRLMWGGIAVLGLVLVVGLFTLLPEPEGAASVEGQASVGAPAPAVDMVAFDGTPVTLSQYEGTPVVLNFWATWCPFCIAEMPDFETVHQATTDQVQFIGVNLQDDPGQADSMVEETGVTYLLTRDPQGVVYSAFGGVAMPTTVFIDADGIVREVVTGQMSKDQLESKISQYFAVDA